MNFGAPTPMEASNGFQVRPLGRAIGAIGSPRSVLSLQDQAGAQIPSSPPRLREVAGPARRFCCFSLFVPLDQGASFPFV